MPRIVRLHTFGGPESLKVQDAPSQQPGAGEARQRVEAAGVNRDRFTFMGGEHCSSQAIVQPKLPSRLGYEVAGVVEAVGERVDRSWIDKRVATVPEFDQNRYARSARRLSHLSACSASTLFGREMLKWKCHPQSRNSGSARKANLAVVDLLSEIAGRNSRAAWRV